MNETTVMCDATETKCRCVLELGHEGPHKCDPIRCGGSWEITKDGKFIVHSLPGFLF